MTKSTLDLRTAKFVCKFHRTVRNNLGEETDMYVLHAPSANDTDYVTLGVPHGRRDVADFVHRCMEAGQNVMRLMPPGESFVANEAQPDLGAGRGVPVSKKEG